MKDMQKGFTLTELLVVVLIVSILVGLGLPGYRDFIQRSGRTDASTALLKMQALQEKFYLQNGIYASNAQLAGAPPAGLGFVGAKTEHGYYNLTLAPDPAGLAVGYTATAAIAAGGKQADDSDCAAFSVDQNGRRGANGGFNPAVVEECWR
jgi:type IV pilus assembly protein PilE